MTIAFIGDIHGHFQPLSEAVQTARAIANHVVFLGDYVNRGPDSRKVINFLIALSSDPAIHTTFLLGNHDAELRRVLSGASIDLLLKMGGAPTVGNYVAHPRGDVAEQLRDSFPDEHREFLSDLQMEFRVDNVLAVHERPADLSDNVFTVSGHRTRKNGVPFVSANEARIDTGCGTAIGGRLTTFFWPERKWSQSSTATEARL